MIKLKLILIGIFFCTVVSAQNFIMKKKLADRYYNRFDYHNAIPMYKQLLNRYPGSFEIYEKLADSYRRINDSENAAKYYAFLVDSTAAKHEYILYYAQALSRTGQYDKAKVWYQKYSELEPGDLRGKDFATAYLNISSFYKDSASYGIWKAPFCSDASDFSPAYYKNGIVFSSARSKFSIVRMLYNWTYSSFLDLFFASTDSANISNFSSNINSVYHEGPVTFNTTEDTIIFTRSNFYQKRLRKSDEGINKLKLFQANWDNTLKKWTNITPLPFNSDQYSVGHPSLSKDAHTLYFASDMPGGAGGTDIYVSKLETDATGHKNWSNPVNLGTGINTAGNEMFPYLDEEGNIWFASNGLPGLGGLDIFVANSAGNGFSSPKNIGTPLNSRFDDFGIITRNGGREGFFTSDRNTTIGNDDIYQYTLNKLSIKGIVRDSTNSIPLEKAAVSLILADGTTVGQVETGKDGSFAFPAGFNAKYTLKISRTGYIPRSEELLTNNVKTAQISKTIDLSKEIVKHVFVYGTIADINTGEKLNEVEVLIIDSTRKVVVLDTITSLDGSFRKELNNIKLNDKLGYNIVLNKKGYLAKKISFNHQVTSFEINLNDYMEVALNKIDVGTDIGKLLQIRPIYFDVGKSNIRKDASVELDKIVKAMKENPGLVIELGSHTDSRGNNEANLSLSDKRAKASAAYVVSKGIEKNRIYGKGYGESQLINQCADGVQCSEDEHAANRRTEFKVVKI